MSHAERRRHVRLKPIADLPARVVYVSDGPLHEALDVVDISAGGIALAKPGHATLAVGGGVKLKMTLGSEPEHLVEVTVRWVSSNAFGAEIVEPAPDALSSIRRYVGELLERGLSV